MKTRRHDDTGSTESPETGGASPTLDVPGLENALAADLAGTPWEGRFDRSIGDLTIPWDELVDGIDANQVGRVYAKVTWHSPDDSTLADDNSLFRNAGAQQFWHISDVN
jgi:hypothetical protein